LTRKKTADLNTRSTVKAVRQARAASSAAAGNATTAAQNAAVIAQNAAQNAAVMAQNAALAATSAARSASGAAQTAAASLSKGVQARVYTARSWAAPRLESAAEYHAKTIAPKVSAALQNAAGQVRPPKATSSKRKMLTWTALGAAIAAGLGAVAVLVRFRFQAAIAADSQPADEEAAAASADRPPASPGTDAAGQPADASTEASVNGRVSTPGW
jgi:hypothetical protein